MSFLSFLIISLHILSLCASPPDSVVAGWPSLIYPNPTSLRSENFSFIGRQSLKKSSASLIVMFKTSLIFLPLCFTFNTSGL